MNVVRQLTLDDYEAWNNFVAQSPQGSLFQTIEWNQMVCETDSQIQGFLPLASFDDKGIQTGIIVCYRSLSGRKIVDPPFSGYISPILALGLNYANRQHTYSNYSILANLLKKLMDEVDYARLVNSPEIWDVRPYTFQSWKIETTYTHIWNKGNLAETWGTVDSAYQKIIYAAEQKFSFELVNKEEHIQQFVKLTGGGGVLQKRIDFLRSRNLCRLYAVTDQQGVKYGMTLAILSRENHTAYLWGSICNDLKLENEIFPYLFWKSYEVLAEEFPHMDLGGSNKYSVSEIKDKLGCEPAPSFITTYKKHRSGKEK